MVHTLFAIQAFELGNRTRSEMVKAAGHHQFARLAAACLLSVCSHRYPCGRPGSSAGVSHPLVNGANSTLPSKETGRILDADGLDVPSSRHGHDDNDDDHGLVIPMDGAPTEAEEADSVSLGPDHDLIVLGRALVLPNLFTDWSESRPIQMLKGGALREHTALSIEARLAVRVVSHLAAASSHAPRATRDSPDRGRGASFHP